MVSPRRIKSKIKTVGNIKKITKAMEAVSASKARTASERAHTARRYSTELVTLAVGLSHDRFVSHPFFKRQKGGKTLLVLISTDKGLCGSFNSNLFKQVSSVINEAQHTGDIIALGKRGEHFARKTQWNLLGSFVDIPVVPSVEDIRPLVALIQEQFLSGEYANVFLCYTHYTSPLVYTPRVMPLLPFTPESIEAFTHDDESRNVSATKMKGVYSFEPTGEEVLLAVIPRLLEGVVYHSVLESRASEHSARMVAMKNATDNAGELVEDLTLLHNTARQAAVTREIAEISAGAEAVS